MERESLTIGALARRGGVNVETVRYYQRRGLLVVPGGPCLRRIRGRLRGDRGGLVMADRRCAPDDVGRRRLLGRRIRHGDHHVRAACPRSVASCLQNR
jgi:MerR family regulatory protein